MKHFFVASMLLFFASFFIMPNAASAQQAVEKYYYHTDLKTMVTTTIYLKYMGYQVEVWRRVNQETWQQCKVSYTSEDKITYIREGNTYHITYDPKNEDAIIVHTNDYTRSTKFYLSTN